MVEKNSKGPSGSNGGDAKRGQYVTAMKALTNYVAMVQQVISQPEIKEALQQAPDYTRKGRTPMQMAVDNLIVGFAETMQDVPKDERPIAFYQAILRFRDGAATSEQAAKASLTKAVNHVKTSNKLKLESSEFFELLFEKSHPNNIAQLINARRNVLVEGSKLLLSDTALKSQDNLRESSNQLAIYFNQLIKDWVKSHAPKQGPNGTPRQPGQKQDADDDQGARIHRVEDLDDVDVEMKRLIGMEKPKGMIEEIRARVEHAVMLKKAGLAPEKGGEGLEHYVFDGNPGTGKTTFARLIGKIYQESGLLKKGHVVEGDRGSLVAGYVGQTALKVKEMVKKALDGVLFIDEAYLLDGQGNDFGKEAMGTLLKEIELNKDRLVVVLAGYPREMDQLMKSNPGLTRRFKYHMNFPDFDAKELMQILDINLKRRNMKVTDEARVKIEKLLIDSKNAEGQNFGNAGAVENIVDILASKLSLKLKQDGLLDKFKAAANDNGGAGKDAKNQKPDPAWAAQLVTITEDIVDQVKPKKAPQSRKRIGYSPS